MPTETRDIETLTSERVYTPTSTNGGSLEKYHTRTCRYYKQIGSTRSWEREFAERWGLDHCPRCADGEGKPL